MPFEETSDAPINGNLMGPFATEAEAIAACNDSNSNSGGCDFAGELYCSISPSCGIPPGPMYSEAGDTSWIWGATVSCGEPGAGWQAILTCEAGVYTLTTTDGENLTVVPTSTSPFLLTHTWTPPAGQCCEGTEVTMTITQ